MLSKPHTWSQEDYRLYCTQLDLFLQILQEEESKRTETGLIPDPTPRLSHVIRQGESDGTFWFVLCARSGLFFDELWYRFERFDHVGSQAKEARQAALGGEHSSKRFQSLAE
jgi:hypothetical protein